MQGKVREAKAVRPFEPHSIFFETGDVNILALPIALIQHPAERTSG